MFTVKRVLIFLGILLTVFLAWRFFFGQKSKSETLKLQKRDLEVSLTVSGKVEAVRQAALAFGVSGELVYIASGGAVLKKGEVAARLKTDELWAGQKTAEANLAKAQAAYDNALSVKRENDLNYAWRHDDVSREKVEQVDASTQGIKASLEAAQGTLDGAKASLAKAYIRSPFAGIVGFVTGKIGESVAGLSPVLTLIDPTEFEFEAEVDEVDVVSLKTDQPSLVALDAFPNQTLKGRIAQIDSASHISSAGGTAYNIKIRFEEGSQDLAALKSGFSGEARILKETKKGVLLVPAVFVTQEEGKSFVTILGSGGMRGKTQVVLGDFAEGGYEVVSGLNEGVTLEREVKK